MRTSHFCAAKIAAQLVRPTCNPYPVCADTSQHCFTTCRRADSHPDEFPSLFNSLGTFKRESYAMQLKPDAKSFALYITRNISIPLRKKGAAGTIPCGILQHYIARRGAHTMVRRNDCCAKTIRCSQNLCRFSITEWECFAKPTHCWTLMQH